MKKIFAIALTILTLNYAVAQEVRQQRTINVSGSAETEVTPDEIYVQIDLREYDKKGAGKVDIQTIRNHFLNNVKALGIPETDISVQGFSGYDNYYTWYKKDKQKNPDLKASISYVVKFSSIAKMDELVAKLDDEATQNFSIQKADYSKKFDLKKQLKIQAVKNAKEKAAYLAEAIGEQVGGAITINEPNEVTGWPQPRVYANSMMKVNAMESAQAAPAMNVDYKKIKLQFDVQVTFALK
ncbi:MAG: hypothetical protein JWN76_1594 [Chitinophagaceae bacterium]|nr:hypothetical protein [Chitinophagaceae bacterium]